MTQDKHVFLTLDGLRGLAAIAVALLHGWLLFGGPITEIPLERANLAVDLFFLMSGVVIAHAYDRRIAGSMTPGAFMRARIIRLYPLYILGALFGMARVASDVLSQGATGEWTQANFLLAVVCNVFMLPAKVGMEPALYPFNPPSWSLFQELIVNFAYVLAFPLLTNKRLLAIVIVSGLGFAFVSIGLGLLNPGHYWSNVLAGLPRVFFSFRWAS